MAFKKNQVIDIVIFGTCLFGVLLLREYRVEVSETIDWWIPAIPLAVIGLLFGFRGSNAYKDDHSSAASTPAPESRSKKPNKKRKKKK